MYCRMIYKDDTTTMTTRPQVLIYDPKTFPAWNAKSGCWSEKDGPPSVAVGIPALLHVCRESRQFALEHVYIRRLKKKDTRKRNPDAYHHIISRPFDVEKDQIFVHPTVSGPFFRRVVKNTPWLAQNLILSFAAIFDTAFWRREPRRRNVMRWRRCLLYFPQCKNLKSVRFIRTPPPDNDDDPYPVDQLMDGVNPSRDHHVVEAENMMPNVLLLCQFEFNDTYTPNGISWKELSLTGGLDKILLEFGFVNVERITN